MKKENVEIALTLREALLFHVMQKGCISAKLTKEGTLLVEQDTPPEYMVRHKAKNMNTQELLNRLIETRLWYLWENGQLYTLELPKVKIMPFEIKPEGFGKKGALVCSVNGEDKTGYKEIAEAIFGGYHKDLLNELKPYLRTNFDLDEIVFVRMATKRGNDYPVFRWQGHNFYGIGQVKKKMFWLTDDDIEQLKGRVVKDKKRVAKRRSDQLVRLFDITYTEGEYMLTNPDNQKEELSFKYKKGVLDYIRQHEKGGTVSRETSKQIFEIVGGAWR